MMPLSVLWSVDRLIDGVGNNPIADVIAGRWSSNAGSVRFFRSSANFIYRLSINGESHYLRFAAGSERTAQRIAAELDVVEKIGDAGLKVAEPVPSTNSGLVESVSTDLGLFHAVVFSALAGSTIDLDEIDPTAAYRWGECLGRFHQATDQISFAARGCLPDWRSRLMRSISTQIVPDSVVAELEAVLTKLGRLASPPSMSGLLHGDFELDNLVWRDGSPAILDFDDCFTGWFALDMVMALRDLDWHWVGAMPSTVTAFVHGYRTQRDIDESVWRLMPLFARYDRLVQYLRIRRALDRPPDAEDPEWLLGLERKLRTRAEQFECSLTSN